MIQVRKIASEDVRPMRQAVLRPKQTIAEMAWTHDNDPDTVHLGAFEGERLVGILTLYPAEYPLNLTLLPAWQLRGMATLPEVRGSGAGKLLIAHSIEICREHSARIVWCDARLTATGFYAKLGFRQEGDLFEKPGAGPHIRMYLEL